MNMKSFVIRPSLFVISAGVLLFSAGGRCLSQDKEQPENGVRGVQIRLRAEGLDVVSPELNGREPGLPETPMLPPGTKSVSELHAPDHGGPPRIGLSLTGPPHGGLPHGGAPGFGPPGFGPSMLQMKGRAELNPGQGSQFHHPEAHGSEGRFAEDRRRLAALTEAAERISQAGLPDVAHGLRERAAQLERELAEKQERMQQEERQRTESAMRERQKEERQQPQRLMEQRREGVERGDHPTAPLRELHEQMEHLRRDMHKLSEQMTDLTRLIQQHHHPRNARGHHEDRDDDEDHKESGEHEDE